MIRLTRAQTQPIGLDIGSDSVRMLQLEVANNQLSVLAAAQQQLPDDAKNDANRRIPAAVEIIKSMITQPGFSGRRVVMALPRQIVHMKNLRLPMIPAAELAAAVQFEARNIFSFDPDNARIHFLPAGEIRQGGDVRQEVIVVAAANQDVDAFLEQMGEAGIDIDSLDVESTGLFRCVEKFIRRREDEHEVQVVVDIGAKRSAVIIGKGRDISFFKSLDVGGIQVTEAVSRKLGITMEEARGLRRRLSESTDDPAHKRDPVRQAVFDATRSIVEELGREISLCLRYYSVTFRGHRPRNVRLAGGESCDPQVLAVLNSVLTIPVEPSKAMHSVDTSRMKPSDRRGNMAEWSLAFGLGLKRTSGYFGSRDGKPRDPNAPRAEPAEVVDLNKAVASPAASVAAGPTPEMPPEAAAAARQPVGVGRA